MRKAIPLLFAASLVCVPSLVQADEAKSYQPIPVQAQVHKPGDSLSIGKLSAVGAGMVAGVLIANATLPLTWGIAAPVLGGAVGGMLGNWGYNRATGEPSMLRRASAPVEADAPTLFQLAVLSDER